MTTIELIIKHGISVRQIPHCITSSYEARHHKPGNAIVTRYAPDFYPDEKDGNLRYVFRRRFPAGRQFTIEKRYPKNGGKWMAKMSTTSDSMVQWSIKDDCLADTLEESVAMLVSKRNLSI